MCFGIMITTHNFPIDYRNLKDMNDNSDLPQKQSHNLLENISKIEGLLTKKILVKLNLLPS